jgi:hypothetical protein
MLLAGIQAKLGWTPIKTFGLPVPTRQTGGDEFGSRHVLDTPQLVARVVHFQGPGPQRFGY